MMSFFMILGLFWKSKYAFLVICRTKCFRDLARIYD